MGKSFYFPKNIIEEIRIAGLLGFYVWQTNKVEMAQDEGPVFEAGIQIKRNKYSFFAEFGGYTGYDAYEYYDRISGLDRIQGNNDPLIMRLRFEREGKLFTLNAEYQTGFRDYKYQTFRIGVAYRFIPTLLY